MSCDFEKVIIDLNEVVIVGVLARAEIALNVVELIIK